MVDEDHRRQTGRKRGCSRQPVIRSCSRSKRAGKSTTPRAQVHSSTSAKGSTASQYRRGLRATGTVRTGHESRGTKAGACTQRALAALLVRDCPKETTYTLPLPQYTYPVPARTLPPYVAEGPRRTHARNSGPAADARPGEDPIQFESPDDRRRRTAQAGVDRDRRRGAGRWRRCAERLRQCTAPAERRTHGTHRAQDAGLVVRKGERQTDGRRRGTRRTGRLDGQKETHGQSGWAEGPGTHETQSYSYVDSKQIATTSENVDGQEEARQPTSTDLSLSTATFASCAELPSPATPSSCFSREFSFPASRKYRIQSFPGSIYFLWAFTLFTRSKKHYRLPLFVNICESTREPKTRARDRTGMDPTASATGYTPAAHNTIRFPILNARFRAPSGVNTRSKATSRQSLRIPVGFSASPHSRALSNAEQGGEEFLFTIESMDSGINPTTTPSRLRAANPVSRLSS
ncbi:hypothetical protein C8R45DRAFT_1188813 [Mycena sanguinolenta]|nr:hypothetical protein C8R45DRAFT_1188813 [Mycena sanguinolenta]